MSIIYDALKKIEKPEQAQFDVAATHKVRRFKYKTYVLYSVIVCVGLLIGSVFFKFLGRGGKHSKKEAPASVSEEMIFTPVYDPADEPVLEESTEYARPRPQGEPRGTLVLSGVYFSHDVGYALINNRIVKEGDTISGGKVKRVSLDEVVLEYEDGAVTLRSRK